MPTSAHYYCFSGRCGHRPLQNYSHKLQFIWIIHGDFCYMRRTHTGLKTLIRSWVSSITLTQSQPLLINKVSAWIRSLQIGLPWPQIIDSGNLFHFWILKALSYLIMCVYICSFGQKFAWIFSIISYRKIQANFLASQIYTNTHIYAI